MGLKIFKNRDNHLKYLLSFIFIVLSFSSNLASSHILMNRYALHYQFISIYGESAGPIIRTEILSRPNTFGGPCSIMEEVLINTEDTIKNISSLYACVEGFSETKAPHHPTDTLTRQVVIQNVCRILAQNKKSLNSFLSGSLLLPQLTDRVHFLTRKFYPFKVINDKVIEKMIKESHKNITHDYFDLDDSLSFDREITFYKSLSFLLCTSEQWQKL